MYRTPHADYDSSVRALADVSIAEQLVMSGGWKRTATARETFRENYLTRRSRYHI